MINPFKKPIVAIFAALAVMSAQAGGQELLSGLTASASSEINITRSPIFAIDGSDLIFAGGDVNDPSNYTSLGADNFGLDTNWHSWTTTDASDEWFAVELGGAFLVDSISVFNVGDQGNAYQTRGVLQADIYYRVGGGLGNNSNLNTTAFDNTGWTLLGTAGTQMFNLGPDGITAIGPDNISLGGVSATAIALDFNTNQGATNGVVGINEIQVFASPAPVGNLAVDGGSVDADFNFGDVYIAAPGTSTVTNAITYVNNGGAPVEVTAISITDNGGGAYALASAPSLPVTLAINDTFTVEVDFGTGGGTGPNLKNGSLSVTTDNVATDLSVPLTGTVVTDGDNVILNENSTLDLDLTDWQNAGGAVSVSGFDPAATVGAVRVRGEEDPAGSSSADSFGQALTVPPGVDPSISFWFSTSDYYGSLGGSFGDRAFQYVILSDGSVPSSEGLADSDFSSAIVNLGYFPDGTDSNTTPGFYLYDGSAWTIVSGLGTINNSDDTGDDGSLDFGSDTINAYQIVIQTNGFGSPSATYDISVSSANSTTVANSVTGLTTSHSVSADSATVGGHFFTAGDGSDGSGNVGNALSGSFWIDEIEVSGGTLPSAVLSIDSVSEQITTLEGAIAPENGILTLSNVGTGLDLTISSITLSDAAFSLVGPNAGVSSIAPGASVDFEIQYDATSKVGELADATDITINTNTLGLTSQVTQTMGIVYAPGDPIFNEGFDVDGAETVNDSDSIAGWAELFGASDIFGVPAIAPTGSQAVRINSGRNLFQRLSFSLTGFEASFYFAVQSGGTRTFSVILIGEGGTVNLRYQGDAWQAFEEGAGFVTVMNAPGGVLAFSEDIDGNGALDVGTDTINVYRLRVIARDFHTGSGDYDLEVYDSSDTLIDSVTGLTAFQGGSSGALATVNFSTQFGGSPGYWVDNFELSNIVLVPAPPSDLAVTDFTADGAGAMTVRFTDNGSTNYSIEISDDLLGSVNASSIPVNLGTADTTTFPGEIVVSFTDPAPATERFLKIQSN